MEPTLGYDPSGQRATDPWPRPVTAPCRGPLPVASVLPSGENRSEITALKPLSPWSKVNFSFPVAASQRLTS